MKRWPFALVCLIVGGLGGALVGNSVLQGQTPGSTGIPKEMTSYREVVKRVLPAVVSVQSHAKVVAAKDRSSTPRRRQGNDNMPPGIPDEFRRFFEDFNGRGFEMTPDDVPQQSFGSGFIIDPKGVVLTNYHVVAGADRVEVTLADGRKFLSRDIKGDRKNDLAIVRLETKSSLPYVELGDSDAMEIGDRVLAVGAPFGLTGSVTSGIVSAKGRSGLNPGHTVYEDYLQTDAAINPGNSGGPLVNLEGRVIGINTAIRTRTGGFQGIGLAITSNLAKNISDQLLHGGVVHRGYLGVSVGPLDPDVASRLGVNGKTGVVVARVFPGTPAAKAGIKNGDVITTLAGKPVGDGRELQRVVGTLPLHKPVEVAVIRDGQSRELSVTVEEQPENYGLASNDDEGTLSPRTEKEEVSVDKLGLDLTDLTADLASRYGFKEDAQGVVISDVQPGSAASEAGLRRGMLISRIDKKQIKSADAAKNMLQKSNLDRGVLLQVQYPQSLGGGTNYVLLKAEPANR
jgi:serine protease Do